MKLAGSASLARLFATAADSIAHLRTESGSGCAESEEKKEGTGAAFKVLLSPGMGPDAEAEGVRPSAPCTRVESGEWRVEGGGWRAV